jgi:peptidoglycan/LPS O-acetylase OafA/YrhL
MVWLGNISFGFYLCQGLVLFQGRLWVGGDRTYPTAVALALWIFMLLLTIVAGWLLYSRVEDPMMRHFSRSRKRPAAAPAATEPVLVGAGEAVAP